MFKKIAATLITAAALIVPAITPATTHAQSITYLHVDYARDRCQADVNPSVQSTSRGTIGVSMPIHEWVQYERINNNNVKIWINWFTSLRTYFIQSYCWVAGTDVNSWSQTIAVSQVYHS
jgi:hypothetical protein